MTENNTAAQTADLISEDLDHTLRWAQQAFDKCQDVCIEPWSYGPNLQYSAVSVFCRSLVEEDQNHYVKTTLQDLVENQAGMAKDVTADMLAGFFGMHGPASQPFYLAETLTEATERIWQCNVVIFFDKWNRAICYKAGCVKKRNVTEPISEPVVQGPREGTVESINTNLGMLRQRVKSTQFKVEFLRAGTTLHTKVAFAYLDQTINPDTMSEFRSRIASLEQYEVLETAYVEDWLQDSTWSPFPQYRYTERTDAAAAALMDGKILVLVDNSPMILICPALFVDFFTTSEDYYVRSVFSTLIRQLRALAFFIALTLPSIYIALSTFHPELIPTVLLLAILDTREGIPFPAFFEALVMEISFELLREAGIRLPRPVGSAVSIVGALVIGQAAIQARIASPIMVIVVALTGIASFAIPHYEMAIAIRILRFPLMVISSVLGGFGLMLGFILTLLHLTCLHTLGQPYLSSLAPFKMRDLRDVFIRVPLHYFLRSPRNRRLHGNRKTVLPGRKQP